MKLRGKIKTYGEDISLLARGLEGPKLYLSHIEELARFPDLTLNKNKSHLLTLQQNKDLECTSIGIDQVYNVKIVGIYFRNAYCASKN